MKIFLEVLMKNHSGLRWVELERQLKDKGISSPETISRYKEEGIKNGWIQGNESRFFITETGIEWLNRNSLMENMPILSRNSKENYSQILGFILPTFNYTSSPTQITSTVTATMIYSEQSKIENLKQNLIFNSLYPLQVWIEKNYCQELNISIKITKNASSISAFYST